CCISCRFFTHRTCPPACAARCHARNGKRASSVHCRGGGPCHDRRRAGFANRPAAFGPAVLLWQKPDGAKADATGAGHFSALTSSYLCPSQVNTPVLASREPWSLAPSITTAPVLASNS